MLNCTTQPADGSRLNSAPRPYANFVTVGGDCERTRNTFPQFYWVSNV